MSGLLNVGVEDQIISEMTIPELRKLGHLIKVREIVDDGTWTLFRLRQKGLTNKYLNEGPKRYQKWFTYEPSMLGLSVYKSAREIYKVRIARRAPEKQPEAKAVIADHGDTK